MGLEPKYHTQLPSPVEENQISFWVNSSPSSPDFSYLHIGCFSPLTLVDS